MDQFRIHFPVVVRSSTFGTKEEHDIIIEISAESRNEAIARFERALEYVIENRSEIANTVRDHIPC